MAPARRQVFKSQLSPVHAKPARSRRPHAFLRLAADAAFSAAAALLRQIGKEVVGAAALFDIAFFKGKRALTMPVVTLRDV